MGVDRNIVPTDVKKGDRVEAAPSFGAAAEEVEAPAVEESNDPQALINDTLKSLEVDSNGKLVYPADMNPILKAAVAATKSFRDTQSSYTKNRQALKEAEAETEALRAQFKAEDPLAGLSDADKSTIADLKFKDPDKWRLIMTDLETKQTQKTQEDFVKLKEEAIAKTEQEVRAEALTAYNKTAEQKLTQQQLLEEVPPKWIKEVTEGKIDFTEFLQRANDLLYGKKTVANPMMDNPTDLNATPGGSKDPQIESGIDYKNITF